MDSFCQVVIPKLQLSPQQCKVTKTINTINLLACEIFCELLQHNMLMWILLTFEKDVEIDSLISTCLKLKSVTEEEWRDDILKSLVSLLSSVSAHSRLWQSLYLAVKHFILDRAIREPHEEIARQFLMVLPKAVWSLDTKNLPLTEDILQTLLAIFKENLWNLRRHQDFLGKVYDSIVPFFCVNVKGKGQLLGPFNRLSLPLQTLALDILFFFPTWTPKLISGIVACCHVSNTMLLLEIIQVVSLCQNTRLILPWESYLSFVFTVGVFRPSKIEVSLKDTQERSRFRSCETLTDCIIRALSISSVDMKSIFSVFEVLLFSLTVRSSWSS
ncbi:hypothetical protein BC829DRAFT_389635 [Chytridium lagenaria]|nr:hypothetical protein BC829DRAFT_389635 [Chytridium lagenaria]